MAEWLLYEHDDGRHSAAPSAEAATFAHGDPAWHRVGPVMVQLPKRRPLGCALAMRVMQSDLYPTLDGDERADCDELVRQNIEWFGRDARGVSLPVEAEAGALSSRLHAAIVVALESHHMHHTGEDENNTLPLVDMLTPRGDTDIARGKEELDLLADSIWNDMDGVVLEWLRARGVKVLSARDELTDDGRVVCGGCGAIEANGEAHAGGCAAGAQGDVK